MGRNNSKFTIGKYHINTMEIIKLFQVNIFMPVTKFPHLTIWLFCKRSFQIFGQFRELFKETNSKNWGFCIEDERERKKTRMAKADFAFRLKGREKTQMAKVVKCCHQVTWAQKSMTKKIE